MAGSAVARDLRRPASGDKKDGAIGGDEIRCVLGQVERTAARDECRGWNGGLHPPYARWEHTVRDDRDYAAHMDYIHFNPVKHGLAREPSDWPFSSFRRCVVAGLYPDGWLGGSAGPPQTGQRR